VGKRYRYKVREREREKTGSKAMSELTGERTV
jgi:hypothetical protein